MSLGAGDYAQTIYAFEPETSGDLGLDVGDVVRITDCVDPNWLVGEKVGHPQKRSGQFPRLYVERLNLPTVRTGQRIFLVLQDFLAEQSGDLELTKGEVIVGTEAVDESWWRGKNGPLKGIFPLSFVTELWHDDGVRSRSYSARAGSLKSRAGSLGGTRTSSVGSFDASKASLDAGVTKVSEPTFARALVNVSPQLDGELAFQLGDLLEITEIIDDDWFFGRCHNKEGLVSAVCVELLIDENGGNSDSVPQEEAEYQNYGSLHQEVSGSAHSSAGEEETLNDAHTEESFESQRLRNASNASYTSENTRSHDAQIVPYARVLYPFQGRPNWRELSLDEGQIVTLIRHVDQDWAEGELDGRVGIFPTSFVEIVVDCSSSSTPRASSVNEEEGSVSKAASDKTNSIYADASVSLSGSGRQGSLSLNDYSCRSGSDRSDQGQTSNCGSVNSKQSSVAASEGHAANKSKDNGQDSSSQIQAGITDVLELAEDSELGLVLHTFAAEVDGDVTVTEGETVEVIRRVNENWLEVRTEAAQTGLVPSNHLEIIGLWPQRPGHGSSGSGSAGSDADRASPRVDSAIDSTEALSGSASVSGRFSDAGSGTASPSWRASLHGDNSSTVQQVEQDRGEAAAMKRLSLPGEDVMQLRRHSGKKPPARPPSLPNKKPSLPPKPGLLPKPFIKPKPTGLSEPPTASLGAQSSPTATRALSVEQTTQKAKKPQMMRAQSEFSPDQRNKSPALITAKPFSSLPRAKPHHVMSPTERRMSMSGLDSIVEMEMEKAKSRSSSAASKEENAELVTAEGASETSTTAVVRDFSLLSNSSLTGVGELRESHQSSQVLTNSSHPTSPYPSHPSIAAGSYGGHESQESVSLLQSEVYNSEQSGEERTSTVGAATNHTQSANTESGQKSLLSLVSSSTAASKRASYAGSSVSAGTNSPNSVTEGVSGGSPVSSRDKDNVTRRKRAPGVRPSSEVISSSSSQASFVNRAFEMEVDEGKLVDLSKDSSRRQVRPPPPRSESNPPTALLVNTKSRAAPARPSGPCIAPAPSRVPLVPATSQPAPLQQPALPAKASTQPPAPPLEDDFPTSRAVPAPPARTISTKTSTQPKKLVPRRPAPRAPIPAGSTNNSNKNNIQPRPSPGIPPSPASPPQRQPPRPASLASPPQRVLPPRPTDLIAFSPEDDSAPIHDFDVPDETTQEMVRDLKVKLEENKADMKTTKNVWVFLANLLRAGL